MAFKHLQAMSFPASFRAVQHCPCRWRPFLLKPSVDPTSVLLPHWGATGLLSASYPPRWPLRWPPHWLLCWPRRFMLAWTALSAAPSSGSSVPSTSGIIPAHFYPWRANKPSAPSANCLTSDMVVSLQLDSQPGREAVRTGILRSSWPPNHQGPAPSSPGTGWGASCPGHRRCATARFSGTWCGYEWFYPPYSIYI